MALIACAECGRPLSDRASACPHCGVPTGRGRQGGYEWRSNAELFGLPLVHFAGGWDPHTGARRIARGIIAVGDIAVGTVALGGAAFGGVAIGGFSLGLASIGGAAIGVLLGVGGFATGYLALGGLAIGYYGLGGLAIGPHSLTELLQSSAAQQNLRSWLGPDVGKLPR